MKYVQYLNKLKKFHKYNIVYRRTQGPNRWASKAKGTQLTALGYTWMGYRAVGPLRRAVISILFCTKFMERCVNVMLFDLSLFVFTPLSWNNYWSFIEIVIITHRTIIIF